MSSGDENKAAVRACFENASRGNFDALDDIVTGDYVLHPADVRGADGLKEMVQGYRDALSGLKVTIDQQFNDGDYVATRYTITGTHDGDLMGTPPSGMGASPRSGRSPTSSGSWARSERCPRWRRAELYAKHGADPLARRRPGSAPCRELAKSRDQSASGSEEAAEATRTSRRTRCRTASTLNVPTIRRSTE
jgi:predicted ester cyclase